MNVELLTLMSLLQAYLQTPEPAAHAQPKAWRRRIFVDRAGGRHRRARCTNSNCAAELLGS